MTQPNIYQGLGSDCLRKLFPNLPEKSAVPLIKALANVKKTTLQQKASDFERCNVTAYFFDNEPLSFKGNLDSSPVNLYHSFLNSIPSKKAQSFIETYGTQNGFINAPAMLLTTSLQISNWQPNNNGMEVSVNLSISGTGDQTVIKVHQELTVSEFSQFQDKNGDPLDEPISITCKNQPLVMRLDYEICKGSDGEFNIDLGNQKVYFE